jgi:hypothetical protein
MTFADLGSVDDSPQVEGRPRRVGDRHGERVQVKYATSDGAVVPIRCRSQSLTSGKVRRTKHYTGETIDILAVYDAASDRCFYVPASELGDGGSILHIRLTPTKNGQRARTRPASEYSPP